MTIAESKKLYIIHQRSEYMLDEYLKLGFKVTPNYYMIGINVDISDCGATNVLDLHKKIKRQAKAKFPDLPKNK